METNKLTDILKEIVIAIDKEPIANVKLEFNKQREQWVVLAPEKLMVPDETSVAILKFCDGKSTIRSIIDKLTAQYKAKREVISRDVTGLIQDLADKGFMVTVNEGQD